LDIRRTGIFLRNRNHLRNALSFAQSARAKRRKIFGREQFGLIRSNKLFDLFIRLN
jgi:hypothetical protein